MQSANSINYRPVRKWLLMFCMANAAILLFVWFWHPSTAISRGYQGDRRVTVEELGGKKINHLSWRTYEKKDTAVAFRHGIDIGRCECSEQRA
jgi:hypothetical protein